MDRETVVEMNSTSKNNQLEQKSAHSFQPLSEAEGAILSFENITYTVGDARRGTQKQILKGVSGVVKPGEVLGIMGASGCGKTTLIEVLANRTSSGVVGGSTMINGVDVKQIKYKHIAKYVPQEDNLMGTMSVYETLKFSAELSLGADVSEEEKINRVKLVAEQLGLVKCLNTKIGNVFQKGISGGQKRRVSIGIEMISLPKVLFLDEPTSGLDSESSSRVMDILRQIALSGRTVLCSIHQPSSEVFQKLDKVMLMSSGSVIYFGPTKDVVPHFSDLNYVCPPYTNPADFLISLINTDFEGDKIAEAEEAVQRLAADYTNSNVSSFVTKEIERLKANPRNIDSEFTPKYRVSFFKQFTELSKRTLVDNFRNPGVFWIRLFMYVMLSLMVGTIFLRMSNGQKEVLDRASLLFYVCAFFVFMSVSAIASFIDERVVFTRERANGWYQVGAYVLANTICGLPHLFIISLVSSGIIYPLAGLNESEGRFGLFLLDLFLSLVVAEAFVVCVSALVPHYIIGMALGAGCFGMFMALEGFFVTYSNIPNYWIWGYYIAFHTYSFEMFMWTEFDGLALKCDRPIAQVVNNATGVVSEVCSFNSGEEVLRFYNMQNVAVWKDVVVLIAMAVIYRIIFYFILSKFHKGKR